MRDDPVALNNSVFPLAYSVFGILLLTIKPPPESIWRWCSGVAVVCQVPFAILNFTEVRRLKPAEFKGISRMLDFPLFSIGITTILLQLYNMTVLNLFWPFFAGIIVHLIAGMLQFIRLVLLPQDNQPAH